MSKFKVGEKVSFKIPEGKVFSRPNFRFGVNSSMEQLVHNRQDFTIKEIKSSLGETILILTEDYGRWSWDEDFFVPTLANRKDVVNIKIIQDGKETCAIMGDKVGKTIKKPSDDNNDEIATMVAVMRVLELDEEVQHRVIDALFGVQESKIQKVRDYVKAISKELKVNE